MEKQPMGLYYGNGEFKTDTEVKRKMALEGRLPEMEFVSPVPVPQDVNFYIESARERSISLHEASPIAENRVVLNLPRMSLINVIGDVHFGHPDTNYDRLQQELELIRNTGDSYVLFVGDLVDGIAWGGESGGEQIASVQEQHGFLRSMFRSLKGKVIAGVSGEHDSKWVARSGYDPYAVMSEVAGAPYIRGTAEITINIGEQAYHISASHKKRGYSMYNSVHPQKREAMFHNQGHDIYVAGHTHRKGIAQDAIRDVNGAHRVTYISVGPYKSEDAYGQREGFVGLEPQEMFGAAFILHQDKHLVEPFYDIVRANEVWNESED